MTAYEGWGRAGRTVTRATGRGIRTRQVTRRTAGGTNLNNHKPYPHPRFSWWNPARLTSRFDSHSSIFERFVGFSRAARTASS